MSITGVLVRAQRSGAGEAGGHRAEGDVRNGMKRSTQRCGGWSPKRSGTAERNAVEDMARSVIEYIT